MQAQDVVQIIQERAPLDLAASWDHVGWQVGDPQAPVRGVLVALDPAETVIQEAQDRNCNLIITHHPLLFQPLRALDPMSPVGRRVARLVRQDMGLWSAHTNLDCVLDGVNGALAHALGLDPASLRPLVPLAQGAYRLEAWVPEALTDMVQDRLRAAGLGTVGDQGARFWELPANGYAGSSFLEETAFVGIVSADRLTAVRAALAGLGPAVPVHLTPLAHHRGVVGWGAVGELPVSLTRAELVDRVRERLGAAHVRVVPGMPGPDAAGPDAYRTITVCGGSGGSYVPDAARAAALYVTGECGYHHAQDAQLLGLTVIEAGHFYTERPVVARLAAWLRFRADVPVYESQLDTAPFVTA
ncbi:MAG: Nif3-like dinuclear metal center hexameric protein [Chloroflexi bacterium]|nr:Nif3-like dinuclear metal center hexameric protein [Chloroflexota bacterium]MBU1747936.1 Nif3-like dinuclear metal center hexameric protein [Chloroflexota bacterium]MBU1877704.1 Nif3-like dinuclear metal center hexameric protein [Chloroflexota bacterium]